MFDREDLGNEIACMFSDAEGHLDRRDLREGFVTRDYENLRANAPADRTEATARFRKKRKSDPARCVILRDYGRKQKAAWRARAKMTKDMLACSAPGGVS